MTVQTGEVLKVVVDFTDAAVNHMQNVWYFQANFLADQTDAAVLAALLQQVSDLYNEVGADMRDTWEDPDVFVDKIAWSGTEWETTARIGEGVAGTTFTNISDHLPYQCAAVCSFRTARPRSRGRTFLPVFGENTQAASTWGAGTLANLADFVTRALIDVVVVAGNTLECGVPSTVTGTFLLFLNGFSSSKVHTQRRRVPGIGF